jgi:hypothetical protein
LIPAISLIWRFAWRHVRAFARRFHMRIPPLSEGSPLRLRSPAELAELALPVILLGDQLFQWIRITVATPNAVDTAVLLLGILLGGFVCRVVDGFLLLGVVGAVLLALPALLTRTPFIEACRWARSQIAARSEE